MELSNGDVEVAAVAQSISFLEIAEKTNKASHLSVNANTIGKDGGGTALLRDEVEVEMVAAAQSGSSVEIAELDGTDYVAIAELPCEVVLVITKCLPDFKDEVSMAETCPQWRHAISTSSDWGSKASPCLMFDYPEKPESNARHFFSLLNGKSFVLELPLAYARRAWGSPHGLLATVGTDFQVQLLNPISQACIDLPPLSMIRNWSSERIPAAIHKVCILKINTHHPVKLLVVMILHPREFLAYNWVRYDGVNCHEWILVDNPRKVYFSDVAYIQRKDQVYALCDNSSLVQINFGGTNSANDQIELVASLPIGEFVGNQLQNEKKGRVYLVDSDDDIFVVYRYSNDIGPDHKTLEFVLYRLNSNELGWEAVRSIEHKAFFIGNGNSWSISQASAVNCKNNCIYFTDDNLDREWVHIGGIDIGIYDIGTRLTNSLDFGVVDTLPGPHSAWITPCLTSNLTIDA